MDALELLIRQQLINSNRFLQLMLHKDNKEDAQEFPGVFCLFKLRSVLILHQFYIRPASDLCTTNIPKLYHIEKINNHKGFATLFYP